MDNEGNKMNVVLQEFEYMIATLKLNKPNDRSDADRYWAITITEVEKAKAVFLAYCTKTE